MEPKHFALAVALISIAYSLGSYFLFNDPFATLTAVFIGALATLYPLYFGRLRTTWVQSAQVAQFLQDALPSAKRESIYQERLRAIKDELEGIENGEIKLSFEELGTYAEKRLRESVRETFQPRYWAIHIVDSDERLMLWLSDFSAYPWLKSYIEAQRDVLNSGGSVSRIFLFDRRWLAQNFAPAQELIKKHNAYFEGTKKPICTLAADLVAVGDDADEEYTILEEKEVFIWRRQGVATPYRGGNYITNEQRVSKVVSAWRRLLANAVDPEEFFAKFQKSRDR